MGLKDVWRVITRPNTRLGDWVNEIRWRFKGKWKVGEDHMLNEYFLVQQRAGNTNSTSFLLTEISTDSYWLQVAKMG